MITGRDFIVFSDDWGRHPFSCQHIMKHFLPNNRLLWVNTIGMRNPRITLYDIKRSLEKIRGWFRPTTFDEVHTEKNLTIINPVMTPYQNISLIRAWNRQSVVRAVCNTMKMLEFCDPIFLTTLPNAADYIGKFNESAIVYYCVDEFTKWPGVNAHHVEYMENSLLDKANIVCASAEELCYQKTRNGKRPFLLPHGVDFDHFSAGAANSGSKLQYIPHPIIGFFGALSPWLDFSLLSDLAEAKPNWSFVFIGPADADISHLSRHRNVYLIGKTPYAELPQLAAVFDVGIIPFLITEMTICVNPLKLLEYLAMGIPVVSTRLPEVEKYGDLVYIAETAVEFAQKIEQALIDSDQRLQERRVVAARKASWEAIAERLSQHIEMFLQNRSSET